jgi:hypothetical protein
MSEISKSPIKECFVIMPISDVPGYPQGHFGEVYSDLIKPAVEAAGFKPIRADEVSASNLIQADIINRILQSDICICDVSARNPNVLFEFGFRQAFDMPTVIIKDEITDTIFDVSGFRYIEYESSKRYANIIKKRDEISSSLTQTVQAQGKDGQIFSLVKLLGLSKAASVPNADVNPVDAKLAILENRISDIHSLISKKFDALMDQRAANDYAFARGALPVGLGRRAEAAGIGLGFEDSQNATLAALKKIGWGPKLTGG